MMRPAFPICFLVVFAVCARAYPYSAGFSGFSARQVNTTDPCNATCRVYDSLEDQCNAPHCGCTTAFFQAQGACLLCEADDAADAAAVQFLLEGERDQCLRDGVRVSFQLQLPPTAVAIIQEIHASNEELRRAQIAFLALQIAGGHIGLVFLIIHGVLSRRVTRDPTMFNFCLTWIFSSIAFSLLLYRGTDGHTIFNSFGYVDPDMCLAQAAVISGAQVMTACSTMALVLKLWLHLRATMDCDLTYTRHTRLISASLLIAPYVLFLAFALPAIFLGRKHFTRTDLQGLEIAVTTDFYCLVMDNSVFLPALYGVTLGLLIITVVFDGFILRILYRHWRSFRAVKLKSSLSLSTLLRVMAFSIYRVVVTVAYGTTLRTVVDKPRIPPSPFPMDAPAPTIQFFIPRWAEIPQAATPLVVFLVLGISQDTMSTLMFWRGKKLSGTAKV